MNIEYARLYSFFLNSLDTLIQWDILQEWPVLDNIKNKKVLFICLHLLFSANIFLSWLWLSLATLFMYLLLSKIFQLLNGAKKAPQLWNSSTLLYLIYTQW